MRTTHLGIGILALAIGVSVAAASPSGFTLTGKDFGTLAVSGTASDITTANWVSGSWSGTVTSQAFALSSGEYLYLYQAHNNGLASLEKLVINPFANPELTTAGYLIANLPSGFSGGGIVPLGHTYDPAPAVLNVSYGFYPDPFFNEVPPNQSTAALFVISANPPTEGQAWVIDNAAANGSVWVPTPEPITLAMLAVGSVVMLRRHRP